MNEIPLTEVELLHQKLNEACKFFVLLEETWKKQLAPILPAKSRQLSPLPN